MAYFKYKTKIELILKYLDEKTKNLNILSDSFKSKGIKKDCKLEESLLNHSEIKNSEDINYLKSKLSVLESAKVNELHEIIKTNLFKKLLNKYGFRAILALYDDILTKNDIKSFTNSFQFEKVMSEYFCFDELRLIKFYNLFTLNCLYTFCNNQFAIFVYLLLALEYNNFQIFFDLFSSDVFIIISEGNLITLNKLKEFGRLIGLSELEMTKTSKELDLVNDKLIDFSHFKEFYCRIIKKM